MSHTLLTKTLKQSEHYIQQAINIQWRNSIW